jgi:hypothetical protein
MILGEFLNRHTNCPICKFHTLTTYFISSRKQYITYSKNYVSATFPLKSIIRGEQDFEASYVLSLIDNSFYIEFFDKKYLKYIPINLIARFKEFNNNINFKSKITIKCLNCYQYYCHSKEFALDFKTSTISNIEIATESFTIVTPMLNENKIFQLVNDHQINQSKVWFWKGDQSPTDFYFNQPKDIKTITLSLIPFINLEKTRERLNNLSLIS